MIWSFVVGLSTCKKSCRVRSLVRMPGAEESVKSGRKFVRTTVALAGYSVALAGYSVEVKDFEMLTNAEEG